MTDEGRPPQAGVISSALHCGNGAAKALHRGGKKCTALVRGYLAQGSREVRRKPLHKSAAAAPKKFSGGAYGSKMDDFVCKFDKRAHFEYNIFYCKGGAVCKDFLPVRCALYPC